MNTQTQTNNHYRPTFKVIRGKAGANTDLETLTLAACNFAFSALWNNSNFSKSEIQTGKLYISEILGAAKNPLRGYRNFCQRVLLARQYVAKLPGRFIPIPSLWLDPEYQNGYRGTADWLNKILTVRESLPDFKIELKALAEAVLEIREEPSRKNFNYWRNYFVEKKAADMLSLFLIIITNGQFA